MRVLQEEDVRHNHVSDEHAAVQLAASLRAGDAGASRNVVFQFTSYPSYLVPSLPSAFSTSVAVCDVDLLL